MGVKAVSTKKVPFAVRCFKGSARKSTHFDNNAIRFMQKHCLTNFGSGLNGNFGGNVQRGGAK